MNCATLHVIRREVRGLCSFSAESSGFFASPRAGSRELYCMPIIYNLSETAREGLALLKSGRAQALKHGRSGKPHLTTFTLSHDETMLMWAPARTSLAKTIGRRVSATGEPKRSIATSEIVELCVGRESAVFKRRANDTGHEHLSLTLRLMGSLPAPPGAGDSSGSPPGPSRETLDVSFESDEHFGLWVAALRHLLKKQQDERSALKRQDELVTDVFKRQPPAPLPPLQYE